MQCLSLVGPAPGRVLRARLSFIHLSIRRFIPGGSGKLGKTPKPFLPIVHGVWSAQPPGGMRAVVGRCPRGWPTLRMQTAKARRLDGCVNHFTEARQPITDAFDAQGSAVRP
jgi:hypothetical protein